MRATVDGLATPHPLAEGLPTLLRGDPFVQQLCAGLDEVLAPVLTTLDCFPAYLDVGTTPVDLLPWLCRWVGLGTGYETELQPDRLRALVAAAPALHARRGTVAGIVLALAAVFDVTAEVAESGAVRWSERSDAPLPGEEGPSVRVTVVEPDGRALDHERVTTYVESLTPAHVIVQVVFVEPAA